MILSHLKGMPTYFDNIWVDLERANGSLKKGLGRIKASASGEYLSLTTQGINLLIKCCDKHKQLDIEHSLSRGSANLVEICHVAADRAKLRIVFFLGPVVDLGDLAITITQEINKRAEKLKIKSHPRSRLDEIFTGDLGIEGHIFSENEYYVPIIVNEVSGEVDPIFGFDRGITLLGRHIELFVHKEQKAINTTLIAKRLNIKVKNRISAAVYLAKVKLNFTDKETLLANFAQSQLKQLTENNSTSYFNVWDKYGDLEGESLLARARDVNILTITHVEVTANGVKLHFNDKIPKALSDMDQVEIINTGDAPQYLKDKELTWNAYSKILVNQFKAKKPLNIKEEEIPVEGQVAQVSKIRNNTIELELTAMPKVDLHSVILCINGDKIQIERRMHARNLILEGRSANPQLGLIIDENGKLSAIKKGKSLKPLTPFVEDKVFAHPATPRQIEAIDIALNTPDIVLIQGPPGTGKTTVIVAILERLNQEFQKNKDYRGQILVSGFQHDAVENLLARLSINAIPSIKFGKKSGTDFSPDRIEKKVTAWCENLAKSIREKNPKLAESEKLESIKSGLLQYQQVPNDVLAFKVLSEIQRLPEIISKPVLGKQIRLLLEELTPEKTTQSFEILRILYGLRCQKTAFLDDGPARAMDLYSALEDSLEANELLIVREAVMYKQDSPLDFLKDLQILRRKLLLSYRPRPDYKVAKPRTDIIQVLQSSINTLRESEKYDNGVDSALVDFLFELETNQEGMKRSMAEYNLVSGATVQQSLGKDIRDFKKNIMAGRDGELSSKVSETKTDLLLSYDTVIIDEAARCSPRDLLIPLSQAEKRIILVGDHRQLPHIIDEEISRQLEEGEQKMTEESMFEYLFRRLKKLEQQDKIIRTVTLDAQFRTHPILGEFTSKYFYEVNDINEKYRSPLPAKFFEQSLPGVEGIAPVWLDVPHHLGKEEKNSAQSRFRRAEAKAVAKKLALWVDHNAGTELTFGVISFYKAQVFEVFKELEIFGITEKVNNNWQISEKYRQLPNGEERIRIGTVDSFQGMEFDVVFLSMVRTESPNKLSKINLDNDKHLSRVFGHLMSVNRLCVSMSRQKKLLVLAGDSYLAGLDITKQAVPGIYHYLQLCKNKGLFDGNDS